MCVCVWGGGGVCGFSGQCIGLTTAKAPFSPTIVYIGWKIFWISKECIGPFSE